MTDYPENPSDVADRMGDPFVGKLEHEDEFKTGIEDEMVDAVENNEYVLFLSHQDGDRIVIGDTELRLQGYYRHHYKTGEIPKDVEWGIMTAREFYNSYDLTPYTTDSMTWI